MCNCRICSMYHRVEELKSKLPEEFAEEFDAITSELMLSEEAASMDRDSMKAKISGQWITDDGWYYERINGKRYKFKKGEVI